MRLEHMLRIWYDGCYVFGKCTHRSQQSIDPVQSVLVSWIYMAHVPITLISSAYAHFFLFRSYPSIDFLVKRLLCASFLLSQMKSLLRYTEPIKMLYVLLLLEPYSVFFIFFAHLFSVCCTVVLFCSTVQIQIFIWMEA